MALLSYQTITNYHNRNCAPDRARANRLLTLDDIREKRRADIYTKRYQFRAFRMLEKRVELLREVASSQNFNDPTSDIDVYQEDLMNESSFADDSFSACQTQQFSSFSDQDPYLPSTSGESSPARTETTDDGTLTPPYDWSPNSNCDDTNEDIDWTLTNVSDRFDDQPLWTPPSPSPSPWSSACSTISSSSYYSNQEIDITSVPSYFLSPQEASSSNCSNGDQPPAQRPKSLALVGHKQAFKRPSATSSPSTPRSSLDVSKIISEFKILENNLRELCMLGDPVKVSNLIRSHWQVLTNVFLSGDFRAIREVISLLNSLACDNLLQPDTLCHMLQNGLVICLKNCLSQTDGLQLTVSLLLEICRSTPTVIAYMIDLLYHSKSLQALNELIETASTNEIKSILKFYYIISETILAQVLNQQQPSQPLLPEIILKTSVSLQTYSPLSTLSKCLSSGLIKSLARTCLSRSYQREEELVTITLIILANTLKLAHIRAMTISASNTPNSMQSSEDGQAVGDILWGFRDSQLESKLALLISALARLQMISETSDQSSQGMGVDHLAARTKQQCEQFLNFYHQYYGQLSVTFASCMENSRPPSVSSSSSSSDWGSSF